MRKLTIHDHIMHVDWSTPAQVQNPRDLKDAYINRLVAVMAGELRHQSM